MAFDVEEIRSRFPALAREENGRNVAYLDGPGGTQVPQAVIDAMSAPLSSGVSNLGGGYGASDLAAEITAEARASAGLLLNAEANTIAFGQNMTSLTFSVSRAIAETWEDGDAIVLTSLDHDANYTPWERAAREKGVEVRVAEFDAETGRLEPDAVIDLIDERARLVAVCLSSNSSTRCSAWIGAMSMRSMQPPTGSSTSRRSIATCSPHRRTSSSGHTPGFSTASPSTWRPSTHTR